MPEDAADATRDDGTGGVAALLAAVAKDRILGSITQAIEVGNLVLLALLLSAEVVSDLRKNPKSAEKGTHLGALTTGTTSSYSPSTPVRTPSKQSRTLPGRRNALEFLASNFSNSKAKALPLPLPLLWFWTGKAAERHLARHTLQNQSEGMSSTDSMTGSTQVWWKARVQPSQQTSSPLPPQDEQ